MNLLSICIPTYNRKDRLDKLLSKICSIKALDIDIDIDIAVFDNGSIDGTQDMIEKYVNSHRVLYFRNNKNIGFDKNMLKILEFGKQNSIYSLWLGDDDLIDERFFKRIPLLLEKNSFDLVVLNSKNYVNNILKRIIYHLGLKKHKSYLKVEKDCVVDDACDFLRGYISKMPFGTLIANNTLIDVEKARKYVGSYHLYSGTIWDYLDMQQSKNKRIKVLVTKEVFVITGIGDKTYSDEMKEVCNGIGVTLALMPERFQEIIIHEIEEICKRNDLGRYTNKIKESYESLRSL